MTDRFKKVKFNPPTEVLLKMQICNDYDLDSHPNKINLTYGAYRNNDGKPWVLPVVQKVKQNLLKDLNNGKTDFDVNQFTSAATNLLLGEDCSALLEKRVFGIQTVSGTGGTRLGAEFFSRILNYTDYYVAKPCWDNYKLIFKNAGFKKCGVYRYWSSKMKYLDIDGLLEDLRNIKKNAIILLCASAHNPTGCDPTEEEWKQIADIMEERDLFPFFVANYTGFASGDYENDAWCVRYFVSRGFELFCAQSFTRTFCLYNERIGNLVVVLKDASLVPAVQSQLNYIAIGMYGHSPSYGAKIVNTILNNPELRTEWKMNLYTMYSRIILMREALYNALIELNTPGNWELILNQNGMFTYTGLTAFQSEYITQKFHVYVLQGGRICLCELTDSNVQYIARSIHETVTNLPALDI